MLVVPASASAGLAAVVMRFDGDPSDGSATDRRIDGFVYVASPFEANDLAVEVLPDAVVFREASLTITPGAGCVPEGPTGVRCPFPTADPAQSVQRAVSVQAADGDDRIALTVLQRDEVSSLLAGGPGNDRISTAAVGRSRPGNLPLAVLDGDAGDDTLLGGADREELVGDDGSDELHAGAGDDTLAGEERTISRPSAPDALDGGPGRDLLTYTGRRALNVDLSDPGPDGRAGEGDRIAAVEDVRGGAGRNNLVGDDGPNTLTARGRGRQSVVGRGGDDRLTTAAGGQLVGGPGNDSLLGDRTPVCGPGDDIAQPLSSLTTECEQTPVYSEDVTVQLQPLHARAGRVRVLFRAMRDGITGRRDERLRGQVIVRRGTRLGRGTVLARGRFSVPRVLLTRAGSTRAFRLTRTGRRLARRGSVAANVTVDLAGERTRYRVRFTRARRAGPAAPPR